MAHQSGIVKTMSIVAILEGLSYLFILFVGMPLKYLAEMPMPNMIGGSIHGALFILYIFLLFPTAKKLSWSFKIIALGALASIIPFATFWFDKKYLHNEVD